MVDGLYGKIYGKLKSPDDDDDDDNYKRMPNTTKEQPVMKRP